MILALVAALSTAYAEPLTLAHQLRALDAAGEALEGEHTVVVGLWSSAESNSSADALWSVTMSVPFANGYAALELDRADNADTIDSVWFLADVWVELTLDGSTLDPRSRIHDVPNAGSGRVTVGTRPTTADEGTLYFNDDSKTLEIYRLGAWQTVRAFPPNAASCKELHDGGISNSGTYDIDPDGVGPQSPQNVYCDMETDGGGWTRVFVATVNDYTSSSIGYISGLTPVISDSTEMLFAFSDPSSGALTTPWVFPTPSVFHSQTPMQATTCGYTTLDVRRLSDGHTATRILRYGTASFSDECDENCSSTWGQVCLKSVSNHGSVGGYQDFPMFTSFVSGSQGVDHCTRSNQIYTVTACSNTRRFTIYVR